MCLYIRRVSFFFFDQSEITALDEESKNNFPEELNS